MKSGKSRMEYEKLHKSQGKLSEFFRTSPLAGVDLSRENSLPRNETKWIRLHPLQSPSTPA